METGKSMEQGVLRTYRLTGARLAPANLARSLKGVAARSDKYGACVTVSIKVGVEVPREIETLWRDEYHGCGIGLVAAELSQDGKLIGINWRIGKESLEVAVPIGAISELDVAYKDKTV